MLHIYSCINSNSGGWLQLGCTKDKLKKYAEFQDMEIVGEYSDEGHSGKNIKGHHEFMRMMDDIEESKDGVDFVLVFKLSRFGRNAADVLSSLQLMQDYGVNLICVEDGIVFFITRTEIHKLRDKSIIDEIRMDIV